MTLSEPKRTDDPYARKKDPDTFMRRVAKAVSGMLAEEVVWLNIPDAIHNPLGEIGVLSTRDGGRISGPISLRDLCP